MCGDWYGNQACSMKIWYNIVPIGVRRVDEGVKCVMGARTKEEWSLILRD